MTVSPHSVFWGSLYLLTVIFLMISGFANQSSENTLLSLHLQGASEYRYTFTRKDSRAWNQNPTQVWDSVSGFKCFCGRKCYAVTGREARGHLEMALRTDTESIWFLK